MNEEEEKCYNLERIAHNERKRQKKIEYFEKISPEKAKELNQRKSRLAKFKKWLKPVGEPKESKPELISNTEIHMRNLALKLLEEDNPKPELGLDLWDTTKRQKEQKLE